MKKMKIPTFSGKEYIKFTESQLKEMLDLIKKARSHEYDEHWSDDGFSDYVLLYPDGKIRATAHYKTSCEEESNIDL